MSAEEQPQQQQRSLYRRHRPRTFAEVVGQEPVVRTLRNAVEQGKVHHAYLFVGSRGTGKTSMAKILAACLNCERGPTVEPCGTCDSCLSIARASSLDVIEMDAASNNSVDDIRELRESVAYAPVSGRRKVYILDEAHMLSTAAWNAFLKTLEEPPPSTVFVLATTEATKVPPTVVDRCHRFDFHRPTVEQIASVVRRVADAEAIEIPPAAVAALARAATGSFRDALGTLEQLVTYSGAHVALEDVLAVLGVADSRLVEQMIDAAAAGDAAAALTGLEASLEHGRDAAAVARDLELRARELLLVQTLDAVPAELSLTPESDEALLAQAHRCPPATVVRLLELLGEAMEGIRAGADPRTRLELALVKAARPALDGSPRALLDRIERLEAHQPGHAPPAPPVGPPAAATSLQPAASPQPDPIAEPPPSADPSPAPSAAPADGAPSGDALAGAGEPAASAPPEPVPAAQASEGAVGDDLESLRSLWPSVIDLVRGEHAMLGALIAEAQPVHVDGEILTLAFASTAKFLRRKAEDPVKRAIVCEALRSLTGRRWRLAYELREIGETRAGEDEVHTEDELVRRFIEEFDAEELPGEWQGLPGEGEAEEVAPLGEVQARDARVASANEKGS